MHGLILTQIFIHSPLPTRLDRFLEMEIIIPNNPTLKGREGEK
jgi:hypothetical protein